MTTELAPAMMTTEEAHVAADEIRKLTQAFARDLGRLRALALEFHERKGWVALGYNSIEACAKNEFGWKRSQFYRQLTAGKIEESAGIPVGSSPERSVRAVVKGTQQRVPLGDDSLPRSCGGGNNLGAPRASSVRRAVEKVEGKQEEEPMVFGSVSIITPQGSKTITIDAATPVSEVSKAVEEASNATQEPEGTRSDARSGQAGAEASVQDAGETEAEELTLDFSSMDKRSRVAVPSADDDWTITLIERRALEARKATLGDVLSVYWRVVKRAESDTRAGMVCRALLKGSGDPD